MNNKSAIYNQQEIFFFRLGIGIKNIILFIYTMYFLMRSKKSISFHYSVNGKLKIKYKAKQNVQFAP